MADQQTLDVYNQRAEEYANHEDTGVHHTIRTFADRLPHGASLLDLGCGHGELSAYFRDRGCQVTAWDASPAMQQVAQDAYGIEVELKTFDDLHGESLYQAICANYSLLHAQPEDFPRYLSAIAKALQPGGRLCLGMKLGEGTERDKLGRFYAYYSEQQLFDWLTERGFHIEFSHQTVIAGLAGNPKTGICIHAKKA